MQPPPLSPDEPIRLAALRELNQVETPIEERFERITRMACRIFDVPIAAVSLLEADRQWFKSIHGLPCSQTSRDISFCGHTILSDKVFVVQDAREDERFADNPLVVEEPKIVFYAGVPLRAENGSSVGSLCLIDRQPKRLNAEDRAILTDLAALAEAELKVLASGAVQAELIEAYNAERRRGLIDGLTRVWNREGVLEVLEIALKRTAQGGPGVGVVMADLDNFKPINDTFGHPGGDEALRESAKRLLSAVRSTDAVGRLGGDEFLLVVEPCDSVGCGHEVAERARELICSGPITHAGSSFEVDASFGVFHVASGSSVSVEEAIAQADRLLYESKSGGGGRVSVTEETSTDARAA